MHIGSGLQPLLQRLSKQVTCNPPCLSLRFLLSWVESFQSQTFPEDVVHPWRLWAFLITLSTWELFKVLFPQMYQFLIFPLRFLCVYYFPQPLLSFVQSLLLYFLVFFSPCPWGSSKSGETKASPLHHSFQQLSLQPPFPTAPLSLDHVVKASRHGRKHTIPYESGLFCSLLSQDHNLTTQTWVTILTRQREAKTWLTCACLWPFSWLSGCLAVFLLGLSFWASVKLVLTLFANCLQCFWAGTDPRSSSLHSPGCWHPYTSLVFVASFSDR